MRHAVKVGDIVGEYLEYARQKQRPRSFRETERYLTNHLKPLHREVADQCPRAVIAGVLERVAHKSGHGAANCARATLSAFWMWGLKTGRINGEANPVAITIRHEKTPRDRVMSDGELKAVWTATEDNGDYDRIVRLCLLTGCRREEIGGLRWSEVSDEWITIGAERMKGKVAHEVAKLPAISALLPEQRGGPCVFGPGGVGFTRFSSRKENLDRRLAKAGHHLPKWGLHDVRRTVSTRLHDAGAQPFVVEALLAHKQQGVAAVYNKASFRVAKREALATWHVLLEGIVGGVVP
jgi:integrase